MHAQNRLVNIYVIYAHRYSAFEICIDALLQNQKPHWTTCMQCTLSGQAQEKERRKNGRTYYAER